MTVLVRPIPALATSYEALPFKVFVPRELELEPAKAVWTALLEEEMIVLADPFALPGVSTVFPGALFVPLGLIEEPLQIIAALIESVAADFPEEFEDAWVELWNPEALDDEVEALDVTDLTQPS